MEHIMRLHKTPFEMIQKGEKETEYRLNDKKRQKIQINDTIIFYKRPEEKEKIKVVVTSLKHYKDLLEMFTDNFEKDFKNKYKDPKEVVKDTPYYSQEEVNKYGCLAIGIKKIL